jgi:hypothetical protein
MARTIVIIEAVDERGKSLVKIGVFKPNLAFRRNQQKCMSELGFFRAIGIAFS